jgi:hypothetical protein
MRLRATWLRAAFCSVDGVAEEFELATRRCPPLKETPRMGDVPARYVVPRSCVIVLIA